MLGGIEGLRYMLVNICAPKRTHYNFLLTVRSIKICCKTLRGELNVILNPDSDRKILFTKIILNLLITFYYMDTNEIFGG